jgi:hypothetical protein
VRLSKNGKGDEEVGEEGGVAELLEVHISHPNSGGGDQEDFVV